MKTKFLILIVLIFVYGCNISLPGDKVRDQVFDVDYINDLSSSVTLISYLDGQIKDKFEVKPKSKKRFNNVTFKVNGERINVPFVMKFDSVLILDNAEKPASLNYKSYVKQCDKFYFKSDTKPCLNDSSYNNLVFGYGAKSINSNQRKWYSLNKGEFLYRYTFDEKFFENAYKMYDFKARGL